jgi:hypothetical protein
MIEFPCRCGRGFSVPDDQAGKSFQCPDCQRLVEVPLLSELQSIDADGSYKVEELEFKEDEERIRELRRIYLAGHSGRDTQQVDLRTTDEDLQKAGAVDPRDAQDGLIPGAPIYDPVTGELIEPIDIKPEPKKPMAAVPVDANANTLNYARKEIDVITPLNFANVLLTLVRPGSLATLGVIIAIHVYELAGFYIAAKGLLFVVLLTFPPFLMLFSYFPKLVTEFGPDEADELPGIFHEAEFVSDIWTPFVHLIMALALSYFPMFLTDNHYLDIAFLGLGTFVFPAMLLTTCCSGIIADLRPDRLISVIRVCGVKYLISVLLWVATVWGYGYVMILNMGIFTPNLNVTPVMMMGPLLLLPGILIPILFSIHLASFYRTHYAEFPWVFQDQIIRMKRVEKSKRRRSKKLKYERESPGPVPQTPKP